MSSTQGQEWDDCARRTPTLLSWEILLWLITSEKKRKEKQKPALFLRIYLRMSFNCLLGNGGKVIKVNKELSEKSSQTIAVGCWQLTLAGHPWRVCQGTPSASEPSQSSQCISLPSWDFRLLLCFRPFVVCVSRVAVLVPFLVITLIFSVVCTPSQNVPKWINFQGNSFTLWACGRCGGAHWYLCSSQCSYLQKKAQEGTA